MVVMLECIQFIKKSTQTTAKSRNLLKNMTDLTEMRIVKKTRFMVLPPSLVKSISPTPNIMD